MCIGRKAKASEFIGGTCIAANLAGNMARWRKRWSDAVGVWGGWWGVSLAGGGGGVTGGEFREKVSLEIGAATREGYRQLASVEKSFRATM
uniref:Uncharacterized protein n=1 Tax=Vespula pensylvanica TaxID=30213 RepID=A0A834UC99_VESPE|nr:hypothetical protein H0235_006041 [Vespula pensylvanica]